MSGRYINSKRGNISVFLAFILATVISVTAVFIFAAKQKAYTGISDGVLNLAMRSVLSEYDLTLYERYGLMAFEKNGMETSLEIMDYLDYSFEKEVPVKKIQVSYGDYSLANINMLKEQIDEFMKIRIAENLINADRTYIERSDIEDRTLRNQGLINCLPSKPFADGGIGFADRIEQLKDQIKDAEDLIGESSETYLLDTYIMDRFKYATGGPVEESSFFEHEVEYILAGNYSNKKNRENVETGLKVLRIALNTAYLYSDEKHNAQTLAAAELLTPGAAPATQAIIITTWATAEASNDVKLLLKGRPVPLLKNDSSWATSLDNVLNNVSEDFIDTGNKKGLYYDEYIMIFLHFQNETIKLARIADLIQINMKAAADRDFLMKTSNAGMELSAEIYGKEYSYESRY